jgi:type VI secretion system protein ImpA
MDRLDIVSLQAEISPEFPCGDDLESDDEYASLERCAQRKTIQNADGLYETVEPNWNEVRDSAVKLFSRTKNLRVACFLTEAQTNLDGVVGFSDALKLLSNLVERYWDAIYPRLDPEDYNDPIERINILMSLCHHESVLGDLPKQPIVISRGFGNFSHRDIQIANGVLPVPENSSNDNESPPPLDPNIIDAAFLECDLETLEENANALNNALKDINALEVFVTEKVGAEKAPNFENLAKLIQDMVRIIQKKLSERGESVNLDSESSVSEDDQGGHDGSSSSRSAFSVGEIKSREEVVRVLDKICTYYKHHEPSSPVPLLLKRAKGLVAKDFMEIIQDLTPDSLSQVEQIGGKEE